MFDKVKKTINTCPPKTVISDDSQDRQWFYFCTPKKLILQCHKAHICEVLPHEGSSPHQKCDWQYHFKILHQ